MQLFAPRAKLLRVQRAAPHQLAVFCDFDGTFSVQDVGSTLAEIHLGERRPALGERYAEGEITAWEYNVELLDGFAFPEAELEAFLLTVELDPGAKELVAWCEAERIPFHILSDGFDHNLDRLQHIHDVRFSYTANRLTYDHGVWRIAPGRPDPQCECGTGACKRACIASYRAEHPGAYCVHIGNGHVSDLCGAIEADQVFAKDTLAPALESRGVEYESYETLSDVRASLDEWLRSEAGA